MSTFINYGENQVPLDPDKIIEKYGGTYIGNFCLPARIGGWVNNPVMVFYQPNPPNPDYSNYYAMYVDEYDRVFIADGLPAFREGIAGVVADDGEIIFSRYRHDYRTSSDGSVIIDGGRDYTKTNTTNTVHLVIDKDKLVVKSEEAV